MKPRRFTTGRRATALLALFALILLAMGSTVGFAAGSDTGGEPCVSCAGCETGECEGKDERPFESHHHCCTTCCMSHASLALSDVFLSPAPLTAEPVRTPASVAVPPVSAEPLYHPPRI